MGVHDKYLSCNLGCGATPLHLIAISGNLETFKETYDKAKDKNPNSAEKGRTFLHFDSKPANLMTNSTKFSKFLLSPDVRAKILQNSTSTITVHY